MRNPNSTRLLAILLTCVLVLPAIAQDKSKDIFLLHAAAVQSDETSYSYSSDSTLKYTAEFLWGMLGETPGFEDSEVDYQSEARAHSLADIYYDPDHAALKAQAESGYRNVILFDSDQAYAYPEILYEGTKQLSKIALEAGSTPMLMMASSRNVGPITLGEYAYRAGNGLGVEVIPGTYAMKDAGMQLQQSAENVARQAWIGACVIYRKITGLDPADTGYTPTYQYFEYYVNASFNYDSRWPIATADLAELTAYANDAITTQEASVRYTTSYELDGSVVYRTIDTSVAPFSDTIRHFYKGSSTHELTSERIATLVNAPENDPLSSAVNFLGNQNYDTRDWTTSDLALRAGTFSNQADKGLLLFVGGSDDGANAQDIIDSNQANLVPMVFNWIKGFDGLSGTASTTAALNNEDCADLWLDYHLRGWKTIPLTVAMGRLAEKIPSFIASDDILHLSDPVLYMNASMMLTSALGKELAIPATMPIRRGSWTHDEISTAVLTGQEVIKELAFMSETSAYVPDSNLAVAINDLPDFPSNEPYSHQLVASGGSGGNSWELIDDTELPSGISLSAGGLLSGSSTDVGTWNVAFKVTDSAGAFRKVGLKLSSIEEPPTVFIGYDFDSDSTDWTAATIVPTGVTASLFTSPMDISSSDPSDTTGVDALGAVFGNSSTAGSVGIQTIDAITSSFTDAVAGDDYMAFTITPDQDVTLELSSVNFKVSLKSPNSVDEYALTDALGNQIGSPVTITTDQAQGTFGTFNSVSVSLIGTAFETITEATEFRIYAWGRGTGATANTIALLDKVTIHGAIATAESAYTTWISGFGLTGDDALATADTEIGGIGDGGIGDGFPNLLEFALGMDPTVADSASKTTFYIESENDSDYFVYEYERLTDYLEAGLSYSLIVTPDLATPSAEIPFDTTIGSPLDGYETVKSRFLRTDSAKFIQLEVQLTE